MNTPQKILTILATMLAMLVMPASSLAVSTRPPQTKLPRMIRASWDMTAPEVKYNCAMLRVYDGGAGGNIYADKTMYIHWVNHGRPTDTRVILRDNHLVPASPLPFWVAMAQYGATYKQILNADGADSYQAREICVGITPENSVMLPADKALPRSVWIKWNNRGKPIYPQPAFDDYAYSRVMFEYERVAAERAERLRLSYIQSTVRNCATASWPWYCTTRNTNIDPVIAAAIQAMYVTKNPTQAQRDIIAYYWNVLPWI